MAARSYNRVMAEPALAAARLVATTLPGMAGAPITGDITPHWRLTPPISPPNTGAT
jgi:hypothetical protein